jgi:arabinofuranosyltransferase
MPHALLWALSCFALLLHALYFDHTADDAYISFRYAQNLARGHGLVWNVGERVMGYSNPLWVWLLALGEWLGVGSPLGARVLGVLTSFATLALMAAHFARVSPRLLPAAVALSLVAANGVVALWTFGGLEGPLLNLLLVRAVLLAIELDPRAKPRAWLELGGCLGLCGMTRPEAIIYAAPVCLFLLVRRVPLARVAMVASVAAALYAGLLVWQYAYYGDPLPNTYYAKKQFLSWPLIARGLEYTELYLKAYLGLPLLVCLVWSWPRVRQGASRGLLPLAIVLTFALFYLSIGGDALVYFRMWQVTVPLVALLSAELVERLQASSAARAGSLSYGLTGVLLLMSLPASFVGYDIDYLRRDDQHLQNLKLAARSLRRLPPDTVVAANVVGILGYESGLPVLDMLGLNDRHIAQAPGKQLGLPAHESHDGGYVLSREPDLIVPGFPVVRDGATVQGLRLVPRYPADEDLFGDPRLGEHYSPIFLPVGERGVLPVFARKSFVARGLL